MFTVLLMAEAVKEVPEVALAYPPKILAIFLFNGEVNTTPPDTEAEPERFTVF
jgi:hypothetical protein